MAVKCALILNNKQICFVRKYCQISNERINDLIDLSHEHDESNKLIKADGVIFAYMPLNETVNNKNFRKNSSFSDLVILIICDLSINYFQLMELTKIISNSLIDVIDTNSNYESCLFDIIFILEELINFKGDLQVSSNFELQKDVINMESYAEKLFEKEQKKKYKTAIFESNKKAFELKKKRQKS